MASAGLLATQADLAMLAPTILSARVPVGAMPDRTGVEVARELGGRPLLRYVDDERVDELEHPGPTFVCPTPYAAADLAGFLALPPGTGPRRHAILLDPARIAVVRGPRWCNLGPGIEYVLPHGYDAAAVVGPGRAVPIR